MAKNLGHDCTHSPGLLLPDRPLFGGSHDMPAAPIDALILQFLGWVESETPTYAQVLDAWQSSCPRLSVWEDVQIAGLVAFDGSRARHVVLTEAGRARLRVAVAASAG